MDGIDKKIEPEGGAAITAKEENGLKKFDIYKQIGPISRPNNGHSNRRNSMCLLTICSGLYPVCIRMARFCLNFKIQSNAQNILPAES